MSSSVVRLERSNCREPADRRVPRRRWNLSVGELIAAAFEVAGGDGGKVKAILSSRELSDALDRRIVLV
jgi:hypothetical protein